MSEHIKVNKTEHASAHAPRRERRPDAYRPQAHPAALLRRAQMNPGTLGPQEVLQLQRTVGNLAVSRYIAAGRVPTVQAKLVVSPADDRYEQEADRVARQVVSETTAAATPGQTRGDSPAQRQVMEEDEERDVRRKAAPDSQPASSSPVGFGGGEVGPDLEQGIEQGRGGGHALDEGLRVRMEEAFGADFGGVRVHTDARADALNRSLQARAFTTGQDIFFRRGEYSPGNTAGQELIAHELTHVEQQRGGESRRAARATQTGRRKDTGAASPARRTSEPGPSGPRVIRRKVGFEFETGVPVRTMSGAKLPYQFEVFKASSKQWKIVADSSALEFVTEPFTENDPGEALLRQALKEIRTWIIAMIKLTQEADPLGSGKVKDVDPTLGKTNYVGTWPFTDEELKIPTGALADGQVTASPQATGGVTLDKIPDLIKAILTQRLGHLANRQVGEQEFDRAGENATLTGMDPLFSGLMLKTAVQFAQMAVVAEKAKLDEAGQDVPAHGFKKLEGLLSLVISYLLTGHMQQALFDYSKLIAPLMSRVDFHQLYKLLEPDEKALFTQDFVLKTAGLTGTHNTRIFAVGFGAASAPNRGPKRGEWIQSIIDGPIDLMSEGAETAVTTGVGGSSSLGAMHKPDKRLGAGIFDPATLAVLELRRLPKVQHYTEWRQTALDIFNLFKELNQ